MTEKTTASSASMRLRELSWARSVLHDAREDRAPRRRIWALQRQFFDALRALDAASPKPKSWLTRNVNVAIEHPDPRVRRLRHKRVIERQILAQKRAPNPRSAEFRLVVHHWMAAFDEREGIMATARKAIWYALTNHSKIPYSPHGIAIIRDSIRGALRDQGFDDVQVIGRLNEDPADQRLGERDIRFEIRVPSGIDHVHLHAVVSV